MVGLVRELECEAAYADHMAAMAHHWMRRAQEAERLAALLVFSVPGRKISVCEHDLARLGEIELTRTNHPNDMTVRFEAKAA